MMPPLDPAKIALTENSFPVGLYESYYFRGNILNGGGGKQAFWIKHNLLMYRDDAHVLVESTIIVFDPDGSGQHHYKCAQVISLKEYLENVIEKGFSWRNFTFNFKNGSFFEVSEQRLRGKLLTDEGLTVRRSSDEIAWDFNITASGNSYYHLSPLRLYHGGFPKKKILTKDIRLSYSGNLTTPLVALEGAFIGMNGHNWGREHAYQYAYANCNQFGEEDAYFDGLTAKILLLGVMKSPYLSIASLRYKGVWRHFNPIKRALFHRVRELQQEKWEVDFKNSTHCMEVSIDGKGEGWSHLNYEHPSRKTSVVHNTKFAKGVIRLYERRPRVLIATLTSDRFELETLISP